MRFKLSVFVSVVVLLFVVLHVPKIVLGVSQGLSEAEVTTKYGFTFPIAELSNCGSIADCGAYCRRDGNLPACMKFVNAHQLTKADVLSFTISDLGNCQIGSDCRNFCNRPENATQCINFADTYDLLSVSNIEISRAFTAAIGSGGTPGSCRTLEECDHYCDDSTHTNECLDYVGKKKLVAEEEVSAARKVAEGLRKGVGTPGQCNGISTCDDYCSDVSHLSECADYAKKVGFYPSEIQADKAGKFIALAVQGHTPGGCTSKEACDAYCAIRSHGVECTDFAVSAGLVSKDDAEAIKKNGGTGPGGCKSKDECSAFCNQPSNQNLCLQYAQQHNVDTGFKGPGGCKDLESCKAYCMAHQDDVACKQYAGQAGGAKGPGGCSDKDSCTAYCTAHQSDPDCQKMAGQYGGTNGPGGCKDEASCKDYCTKNQSDAACQKMAGQYGGFSGPGGCKDQASCTAYCTSNPQDSACAQYGGGANQQKMQQYQQMQGAPSMPNVRGATTDSRGLFQIIFDELFRR